MWESPHEFSGQALPKLRPEIGLRRVAPLKERFAYSWHRWPAWREPLALGELRG